jgi:hypothetical protein
MFRSLAMIVWTNIFFWVGVVVSALIVSAATPGDQHAKEQACIKAGGIMALPLIAGSILLSYYLGKFKILPGTRDPRSKTKEELYADAMGSWSRSGGVYHAGTDPGAGSEFGVSPLPPPSKSRARPATFGSHNQYEAQPPAYSAPQPLHPMQPLPPAAPQPLHQTVFSEHRFHFGGFFSAYGRILAAVTIFGMIGLIVIASPNAVEQGAAYVGLGLTAVAFIGIVWVFCAGLAITRVQLTPEGISWSGLLSKDYSAWETITEVYRMELVLIQRGSRHHVRWVKLIFSDGRSVKFNQCLNGFDLLASSIQLVSSDRILAEKRAQLSSTGEATFGLITLRTDGIIVDGTFIPWLQVRRAAIINGGLDLDTTLSGWFSAVHKYKPLGGVPNYPALLALMGELGHAPARPMEQGRRF